MNMNIKEIVTIEDTYFRVLDIILKSTMVTMVTMVTMMTMVTP